MYAQELVSSAVAAFSLALGAAVGTRCDNSAKSASITIRFCWAEAPIKIAIMTLTIKLDGNWSSFQLANSAPPLSVTDSAIAPSARMLLGPCALVLA